MKGDIMKVRNFTDTVTGIGATVPWSAEAALAAGFGRYMDRDGCDCCKAAGRDGRKIRYVVGGACVLCATMDADLLWPQWSQGDPGRPLPWSTSPEQSEALGLDWYYGSPNHDRMCQHGPHLRKTHVVTGRCVGCEEQAATFKAASRGPRAAARALGKSSYMPAEACPECGTTAMRSVVTNACSGCKTGDARRSPSQIFAEANPGAVMGREVAKAMGFTLYRTGDACRKGHTGWRYVSTGNCLECLRLKAGE